MRVKYITAFVAAVSLLITAGLVAARQERALLRGRVSDTAACPVPGVVVRVAGGDGQQLGKATTDKDGEYQIRLTRLPPGMASVTTEMPGFQAAERQLWLGSGENRWDIFIAVADMTGESGLVRGVVRSTAGGVVPNATVTVTDALSPHKYVQTRTNGVGQYTVPMRWLGKVVVIAVAPNFDSAARMAEVGRDNAVVDLTLAPRPVCDSK